MKPLLIIACGYLLGSIPFGYLLVRLTKNADVRATGSGGTGATNVSRSAGKAAGVVVLVLDAFKGIAAVLLAQRFVGSEANADWVIALTAIACIVGHIFPVWLGFRGGKGVATGLGIFALLAPLAVVGAVAVFVLIVMATRYVSLGSIAAALTLPVFVLILNYAEAGSFKLALAPLLLALVVGGWLIVWMHRANINRLIAGTENKFR